MPKHKERKESEYYKATIRKLRKEVSNLRKQLNRNYKEVDIEDEYPDEEEPQDPVIHCSACPNGYLEYFEIGIRQFTRCTSCGYRSPAKIIK